MSDDVPDQWEELHIHYLECKEKECQMCKDIYEVRTKVDDLWKKYVKR